MKNKLGIACMVLGTALVLASLGLLLWNRQADRQAGEAVDRVLPQLMEQIHLPTPKPSDPTAPTDPEPSYPDPYDPTMTEVEIDGYAYIGYLSIPGAGLELPVMAQWDYPRLKIAPCRYVGSTKTDDLVIAAHNYSRHFGGLSKLEAGERVYFTDMDGVVSTYEVVAVEVLNPTAIEEMTAGDYDLTLFTCTYGGRSRVTARCDRVEE